MRELLKEALSALKEWDGLIKHQYTGSSEAMTAMQYAAWNTLDVIKNVEAELAKPEPIYVMGNYAGEGKVVSASFGLPKGAFDTPESHIALESELATQTALDKKADNARELGLDYEPEQEPVVMWSGEDTGDVAVDFTYPVLDEKSIRKKVQETAWPIPLYTAPPRKSWEGLTDTDIETLIYHQGRMLSSLIIETEAKLKEKNNAV